MKIYLIGGKAGSGKSTLGETIKNELKLQGRKPTIIHLTAPLYYYAKNFFNWDGNIKNKPRKFLQEFGTDIIKNRLKKKDFLLNRLYEDIEILSNYFDTFIITDARRYDEFIKIKEKYQDVTTIKVIRENYENKLSSEEKEHITEIELDNYNDFDYIITNNDLENIEELVKGIIGGMNYE